MTQAPRLSSTATQLTDIETRAGDAALLRAHGEHVGERYDDAELSGRDLSGIAFSECVLTAATLDDTQLRGSRFSETVLSSTFAPTLLAARTSWRDILVDTPRWGSAELFDSELESVHIRGGKIDFLNLRTSRLVNVLIEDCTITDLDLGGVRATRVALSNCRIGTLDLTRANCADVDLRTSEFSAISGIEGMKGTTIDEWQLSLLAPLFAAHLGVVVD
ncbi:pentapeptide repeat-containing protein [Compostimonas suwonensis]|uniref:Pentapeptide repeat protein n=1 Tax=Compostimonas suwonensis TaxID=1048394 RepID=A0A2M9C4V8_9MICO|nr:pentapeptide repeat-containing protein [Compostimonas suwonensis]PJJ65564.1 pentapeptide repeat protein [Compostimonas suwonensis]